MERKYKLMVLVIVSLALVLAAFDYFSRTNQPLTATNITVTPSAIKEKNGPRPVSPPSVSNQPTPPPRPPSSKTTLPRRLISKLPYATKDFAIEYFPKTDQLSVTTYSANSSQAEKAVYDWLSQEGVRNPESLNILWSRNRRFSP